MLLMKIDVIKKNEVVTLKLDGCLDTAATSEFAAALEDNIQQKRLVIDMQNLEFIASSGIRLLVTANKQAVKLGHALAIANMNEVVADVFDVTGLIDVFEIIK